MLKKFCDCCGKEFNQVATFAITNKENQKIIRDTFIDMCKDCIDSGKYNVENEYISVIFKKRKD